MSAEFTVVGGGIGGLVAARSLALAGRSVTLIEASDRLGGTVARHTVADIDLDAGAESFATRGGTVAALATQIGLGADVVAPSAMTAWVQPVTRPAVPLPAAGLLGIPGTPLAADVTAVVGTAAAMRAELDAVMPYLGSRRSATLGSLVRRRMGRDVLELLVAPVVHGVYSVHPDDLPLDRVPGLRAALTRDGSLAAAVRSLRSASPAGSAVGGIRGGVHRLVIELQADLEAFGVDLQLGRRVDSFEGLDGTVVMAAPPDGGRTVVLATLVVDAPGLDTAPRGSGVLVASGAPGIRARALTHATAKWDWLRERAGGRHVLRLSYDEEPADLEAIALQDAEALLGVGFDRMVDFARVEWVRPESSRVAPGVPTVGESVAGSGIAGIVAQATETAESLLGGVE
jgi:oxygen-dependent protoporphyrinogen oxidase